MSNVEIIGDHNSPTSLITQTVSGADIDLQNITGRKKLQLIKSGEMNIDQFISPPNMPGRKLKELRDAHRGRVEEQLKNLDTDEDEDVEGDDGNIVVGEFVSFRGDSHEVLKTREDAVLLSLKLKGETEVKSVWVPKVKVRKG